MIIPATRDIPTAYSDLYCLNTIDKNAAEIEKNIILNISIIKNQRYF
jgi:hypothetical protein